MDYKKYMMLSDAEKFKYFNDMIIALTIIIIGLLVLVLGVYLK